MNDTIHNFIIFAAELLITIGLITLAIYFYNMTKEQAETLQNREKNILQAEADYVITKYEDIEISGATVVSYVKEIKSMVSEVIVSNGDASYTVDSNTPASTFTAMKNSSDKYYIDPTDTYQVKVERNANGLIEKVIITIKK